MKYLLMSIGVSLALMAGGQATMAQSNVVSLPDNAAANKPGYFSPLAGIDGLTKGAIANAEGLTDFLRKLYRFLVGIAATLAVIEIVIGGIQYSTQDIPNAKSNGKQRIWNAIFGLVLVLSPVLVFSLINPAILNLSLQIRPLDTKSRPLPETSSPPIAPPVTPYVQEEVRRGSLNAPNVGETAALNEGFYPKGEAVPAGAWCFEASDGNLCFRNESACAQAFRDPSSKAIASCTKR